jgi:hypothetical protein
LLQGQLRFQVARERHTWTFDRPENSSTGGSPEVSTRLRRNRLVAFIAAITLIIGLCAYSAHGFGDRAHENGHCDECVHFSGTAGSPAHASPVGKPILVARVPVLRPDVIRSARRRVATQLPRGPPDSVDLI